PRSGQQLAHGGCGDDSASRFKPFRGALLQSVIDGECHRAGPPMRKTATIRAAVMTYAAVPRSRSTGPPGVHAPAPPNGRCGGRFDGVVHVPVDDLVEAPLVTDGPGVVPGAE